MRTATLAQWTIVLVAAWLGAALLVATVVAPAAFAALPTRALAGALVGRVLPALFWSGIALGLGVAAVARHAGAGMPGVFAGFVFAGACAIAQLVVTPRIAALRVAIGGPVDALDPSDPRRQAFGRLHGVSVAWMGLGGLAALAALIILVRFLSSRSTA